MAYYVDLYNTQQRGDTAQVITINSFGPQAWYHNNKTYCLWMQRPYSGAAYGIENFVFVYDHSARRLSESVSLPPKFANAADVHGHGALVVTGGGYIIAAHEELTSEGSDSHQSPFIIQKSNAAEDISAFTKITTLGTYLSYPQLSKVGDRIYLTGRNLHSKIDSFYSDDQGATWSAAKTLVNLGNENLWAYNYHINGTSNSKLRIVVNMCDKQNSSPYSQVYSDIYYLESDDGISFTNLQGTYSHDVDSLGALTKSVLDDNYIIRSSGNVAVDNSLSCSSIAPSGRVYSVVRYGKNGAATAPYTKTYELMYFDGAHLVQKDITPFKDLVSASGDTYWYTAIWGIVAYSDTKLEVYGCVEVDGTPELQKWRTEDAGDTWSKVSNFTVASSHEYGLGTITANPSLDKPIVFLTTYKSSAAYSDIAVVADNCSPTLPKTARGYRYGGGLRVGGTIVNGGGKR